MSLTYSPPAGATVLSGGNWIAVKDTDGNTYYESATGVDSTAQAIAGATKYTGPVIISAGTLTVASGAVASGAYVSGGTNNVYVVSGGTLESSVNVNGWTYVRSGGVSSDNTLVSDAGYVAAGGSSVSDTFVAGTAAEGGGDVYTVFKGGYIGGSAVVGSGTTLNVNSGATVQPITVENGGTLHLDSPTSTVGNGVPATGPGDTTISPAYPVAPSGATVLKGGNWIAVKDPDGKTYYESATGIDGTAQAIAGATKYTGPVIISAGTLTVASGATASGAFVSGGSNNIYVVSGGTLESSVNVNGWTYIRSGGVSSDNTLVSDAGNVAAGGSSVSDTFLAGTTADGGNDTYIIYSGGSVDGHTTVGSGTNFYVVSGATVSTPVAYYTAYPQSSYLSATVLSGGSWIAVKGEDGKTYYQSASGADATATPISGATHYSGPVIISAGTLTVASGAVASGAYISGGMNNVYITSGGTLESSVNVNGWTYVRSGGVSSDNTLVSDAGNIASGGSSVSDTFLYGSNGDGAGDVYTVNKGGSVTSSYVGSGTTLQVLSGGSSSFPTVAAGGNYYVTQASSVVCFLPGSMIRTENGDVSVEEIQIGDQVVVFNWENNTQTVQPVVWVGKAHTTVSPDMPDDEAGWPVRVLKNAIADGVPYKDMLITAEHCLFLHNKFVPVRMLVNGESIFYDKTIRSYDYYHVETDRHAVISADGVLTESYLDTGNRASFQQEGKLVALRGPSGTWLDAAAAPLCVERSFVEPLYRALESRKERVAGRSEAVSEARTTDHPDLHLMTDTGSVLYPVRQNGQNYNFILPPDTRFVRILSRASRPADVIGPFVDDRRYMGVAVADVHLLCDGQSYEITTHLQGKKLKGWYDAEGEACAWTNGNAVLPLGDHPARGKISMLSLTLRAAGPYLLSDQTSDYEQARSA
ncbi:Hint domain-containing protein [Acetobacter persici]|uniref:Hint domain-containing protein n=1 Tax=Acetobacter persici TaxID=1076596 RepID=UPI0036DEC8C6